MVITLELPIGARRAASLTVDPVLAYEIRFGALPPWLEDLDTGLARHLARRAVARGIPLAEADALG